MITGSDLFQRLMTLKDLSDIYVDTGDAQAVDTQVLFDSARNAESEYSSMAIGFLVDNPLP